ncbi:MFS transporter [Alicycliphilus denitrificans]|uniref:MFS transporter n=1 Tax=Alicycliphilus denitrificans TaxID=179636 RepID=UPI0009665CA8|nr:MFS transporter [Alicycliphilus denitrificans]MBN9573285.1 MFS transporter [Alicycliphilus denitrificans]OJW84551.1 MAG: MFS transporter [Alicycliphilus sp. 69-12]BCN40007.1 MFS transporter [Alicycliphilus denitrificans]
MTSAPDAPALAPRAALAMLVALTSGFALSSAFRTVAAILAAPLQADFALSPQALGVFAATFHFTFGAMQLFMGIGIDLYGVRRTILAAFPLCIAGALLSALAPGLGLLVLGQALIGVGCAPAFLVCTVFIARHFAPQRFAAMSGMAMALGTLGMLFTGTPLAWLVQQWSWRAGFAVLALMALLAWLWMWRSVREPARSPAHGAPRESVREAVLRFAALFTLAHTWGIVALGAVTYAALISLRGLWLGPMLIARHGFSLVQSGNVALALSVVALCGPMLFGRIDPGPAARRRWIVACTLLLALLFAAMALLHSAWVDVACMLLTGLLSGFIVLQYADVRAAYPAALTGRAMAVFTMAMFLGVAAMQWFTGLVASLAQERGMDPFVAVMGCIAALLVLGAGAFKALPNPPPDGA